MSEHGIRVESGKSDKRRWIKIGRDDTVAGPSRRDDAGTIDRTGESRYHSGNAQIRDDRDDTFDSLYGGSLLRSKEVEGDSTPEAVRVHHGDKIVQTVPTGDPTTEAHADPLGRLPALNIGVQGYADPAYADDPTELTRQLVVDGTYHIRAIVSTLKRRGVANAYSRAFDALAAARYGGEYEGERLFAHDELERLAAARLEKLRLEARRGAMDAEDAHRKGGWVRTLPRDNGSCPLVWRDDALATPAGNIAAAEFLLRRIAQLRRAGYTHEARALRELLPSRDQWREWRAAM